MRANLEVVVVSTFHPPNLVLLGINLVLVNQVVVRVAVDVSLRLLFVTANIW